MEMPLRNAFIPGEPVIYHDSPQGQAKIVFITGGQGPAATVPTPTIVGSGTGGTLPAGTYNYKITYVRGGVESVASAVSVDYVATGTTSSVTVNWTAVSGATSYKVYGRTTASWLFIATVTAPTLTYLDTGSVTPSGASPVANGNISFRGQLDKVSRTNVLPGMGANQYEKRI